MRRFAETCEAVAGTTKKNEKVRLVADYLRSLPVEDATLAALFLTGQPFPRHTEHTLAVGGSLVVQAVSDLAEARPEDIGPVYRKYGDLGGMAAELLSSQAPRKGLALADLRAGLDELARRRGPSQKLPVLRDLLARASALEAKYIVKIITGDMRIGLRENLVEEAIARACERPLAEVQRANMLTGDISETLQRAVAGQLAEARLALFRPVGFMLAVAADTAAEAIDGFEQGAHVEDKYDGIRAQAHVGGGAAKMFSRTLDEIVEFPELQKTLRALPGPLILDGEIVAWQDGRALPFAELQKRLGRKQPSLFISEEVPVVFMAFDILSVGEEMLLDVPLSERRERLEAVLSGKEMVDVQLAPWALMREADELEAAFEAALERGNEGLMIKLPSSPYTPGRRGQYWRKLKAPMATLDVVVVAVEYGHGKRAGLLSDYTFAVRDGERFLVIGKAYSGLTDAEIQEMTEVFKEEAVRDEGFRLWLEPNVVIEVAFNNIQKSDRHEGGFALRFPRIVRLRRDKRPAEADTIERVRELYEGRSTAETRGTPSSRRE